MKKFITSILMAACVQGMAAATVAEESADGKYTIKNGEVTMTIDVNGGKILSYKYGDAEVISQTTFPNSFGSTFWTSPQREWNWPPVAEYDTKACEAAVEGNTLVLTGQKSERFGYRIRKAFTADPADGAIVITYTIVNESGETRQVAPWEISRVPNDGVLFFVAPAVEPANNMTGLPFEFTQGAAWYVMDEARENRKINADGRGWLAYCAKGLLFVKKFQDLKAGQAAPAEAEIQAYANPGKTFVEIEEQGAYATLAPGASVSWTVRWSVVKTDLEPAPSKALLKLAKKLAK